MEFNINDFCVSLVDDNGRTYEENGLTGLGWIEISKNRLKEYFEVIKCNYPYIVVVIQE